MKRVIDLTPGQNLKLMKTTKMTSLLNLPVKRRLNNVVLEKIGRVSLIHGRELGLSKEMILLRTAMCLAKQKST